MDTDTNKSIEKLLHDTTQTLARRAALAAAVCLLMLTVGCKMETRVVRSGWDDFPSDAPVNAAQPAQGSHTGWAIAIERFDQRNRREQANALLAELRTQLISSHLWIEELPGVTTVYYGRFNDPAEQQAREALRDVRQYTRDGTQPYALARATPVGGQASANSDPLNLQQFLGFYSLQVAAYDDQHLSDRHKAAEQHARKLRDEGHEAYYYHGPHRSLVTVGVFSYQEAFMTVGASTGDREKATTRDAYAPVIKQLQREFPHNLVNGQPVTEMNEGQAANQQPSLLVRVI